MNLTDIAASFVQQFPQGAIANIHKQERMLERFGQIAFGGFGLVILAAVGGMIYMIFTKMILTGINFWSGVLLVAFIIFAALSLAYVLFRESINEKKQKLNPHLLAAERENHPAAPQLHEGHFQPAVSVVEDTTDLLPVENKTRKL
jgi:hypothetical protein